MNVHRRKVATKIIGVRDNLSPETQVRATREIPDTNIHMYVYMYVCDINW